MPEVALPSPPRGAGAAVTAQPWWDGYTWWKKRAVASALFLIWVGTFAETCLSQWTGWGSSWLLCLPWMSLEPSGPFCVCRAWASPGRTCKNFPKTGAQSLHQTEGPASLRIRWLAYFLLHPFIIMFACSGSLIPHTMALAWDWLRSTLALAFTSWVTFGNLMSTMDIIIVLQLSKIMYNKRDKMHIKHLAQSLATVRS